MAFVWICYKIGCLIWNVKSKKKMLLLVSYQSNLLKKTTMVILVLMQLLMIIMTASTKELKLLVSSFPFGQNNKKDKLKNIIINGDSKLNNINSYGLSKSNRVSVSNHPGATSENILSVAQETLKTNPDTMIVHSGTNDFTKTTNTLLRNIKKMCEREKESCQVQRLRSPILFIGRTNETLASSLSVLIEDSFFLVKKKYIPNK